jgi:hypothetical protein
MRALLAERLLATVMEWSPDDISRERPLLDVLARLKYDDYQQFSPGMRFIESLAYWLSQFRESWERQSAYDFFKSKLIFCSSAEMNHLVSLAYADHVKPHLLRKVAAEVGLNPWHLPRAMSLKEFSVLERQTLYLGLSDGARTDVFRRFNPRLSHEQVRQSHELADERIEKLLGKLRKGLKEIIQADPTEDQCRFRTIVLLDDFSASGISYLRKDGDLWDGKVGSFLNCLLDPKHSMASLAKPVDLDILIVLYMATDHAAAYLRKQLEPICKGGEIRAVVNVVYPLSEHVRIVRGQNLTFDKVIDTYYDHDNETESTRLGGTDLKYGFAGCGLPLVLSHNTPNNSIGLLWAQGSSMRPLFPRITRHKDRV